MAAANFVSTYCTLSSRARSSACITVHFTAPSPRRLLLDMRDVMRTESLTRCAASVRSKSLTRRAGALTIEGSSWRGDCRDDRAVLGRDGKGAAVRAVDGRSGVASPMPTGTLRTISYHGSEKSRVAKRRARKT